MARNRWLTAAAIACAIAAADQLTKSAITERAADLPYWLADGIGLEIAHNTGVSFGRLQGGGPLVIALVSIITLILTILIWRLPRTYVVPLSLIVGGSLGNLIDRLRYGHVVDYVALGPWPNFNVADAAIVCGAALMGWRVLRSGPAPDGSA